jgi:syntaxin-binding protein 5
LISASLTFSTVGGPDRPLSKRQLAQQRAEAEQERRRDNASSISPAAQYQPYPTQANTQTQEGWGAWASRQLNERTEKLNIVSDGMDNLSQNSAGWADDVNKFVSKQKRGFVMGAVKSKFGI